MSTSRTVIEEPSSNHVSNHVSNHADGTHRSDDRKLPFVGAQIVESGGSIRRTSTSTRRSSLAVETPSGWQTPDPLVRRESLFRVRTAEQESNRPKDADSIDTPRLAPHIGEPLENLARTMSANTERDVTDAPYELRSVSHRSRNTFEGSRPPPSNLTTTGLEGLAEEAGSPVHPAGQGRPVYFRNLAEEVIFVLVCSAGQLLFAWLLGDVNVNQTQLQRALGIKSTELPWLQGAFTIANGLSVILSGSLTDLAPPKYLLVGAFAWLTVWNIVGAFTLVPSRSILFFFVRAMQGLAIGVLSSGSMSILGRVYNPGMRKTRVFSSMAAMAPFGFYLGALQGGALAAHLPWILGTNAILAGLCCVAAYVTIPALKPAADVAGVEAPSLKQFDLLGAVCALMGCLCLLFGLTQGSAVNWAPYTYALIIVGFALLITLFFVERKVPRPLIPTRLWKTKGFAPLMMAYFLGFGAFVGPWQFYAIQFWLRIQNVSPITVALYLTPNAILGVLATFIVSRIMHRVPGHWTYAISMVAFGMGPVFFLPQTPNTTYWALSMPGVALATFGPDLSFAAASIFITSNVARSYQGSAGSLLMTVQNLSAAVMTAVADAVGSQVDLNENGEVGLKGLRAIWWFGFGAAMVGVLITIVGIRIPKEEEKEHIT